jgi:hypothetical protein
MRTEQKKHLLCTERSEFLRKRELTDRRERQREQKEEKKKEEEEEEERRTAVLRSTEQRRKQKKMGSTVHTRRVTIPKIPNNAN